MKILFFKREVGKIQAFLSSKSSLRDDFVSYYTSGASNKNRNTLNFTRRPLETRSWAGPNCFVLLGNLAGVVRADVFGIDKEGIVDRVKDGDSFNLTSGEKIRFADIDAPEWNETGEIAAKNYLIDFSTHMESMFSWMSTASPEMMAGDD